MTKTGNKAKACCRGNFDFPRSPSTRAVPPPWTQRKGATRTTGPVNAMLSMGFFHVLLTPARLVGSCLPPSALRLPPSALRPPPSALRLPPSAFRLPPSALRLHVLSANKLVGRSNPLRFCVKVLEWPKSNKNWLQHLFLVLTVFHVFPLTGFSPKFHSFRSLDNFGDNPCQFT